MKPAMWRVATSRSDFAGRKIDSISCRDWPITCTSARNGLGGCPVSDPVSVAEDLFTPMRCKLDYYHPARYTEQLDTDVDDCST